MNAVKASKNRAGRYSSKLLTSVSVSALILLGQPSTGFAADRHWDANGTAVGNGGTGVWNLGNLNWSPSGDGVSGPYSTPWSNAALDNAIFGGTAGTVTLGSPITVHNLAFDVGGYTLTGGTLTLAGSAPTIDSVGVNTIDSVLAGTSGLTKVGSGAVVLNGVNTFAGGIVLNAGSLYAKNDAALGHLSNNIVTAAGVQVRLSIGGTGTARSVAIGNGGTLILEGAGAGSAHITGDGSVSVGVNGVTMGNDANTYTGRTVFSGCNGVCTTYFTSIGDLGQASSLGAPTTVSDGTVVFNQSSQYSDSVIYIGDGDSSNRNWDLNGSAAIIRNQGTGALTLTGDVDVSAGGSFNAETADFNLLGVLSGGNYTFSAASGRAITLSGANTFSGQVVIAGLLQASVLADAGVASSLGTGTDIVLSAGMLSYSGTGSSSNRPWTLNGANGILNDGSGALALTGNLVFNPANPGPDSLTLGGSFAGASTFSGVISGTGNVIGKGTGIWVMEGANTFTGTVTVDEGTLRAGNASAFGNTTGFVVNGGTLDLNGYDLTAPSLAGTGGTIALGSGTLTVNATTAQSFGGSISGSGGLTKIGAGTLTLTGASSYTGATTVGGGRLALDFTGTGGPAENILSSSSPLVLSGGILDVTGAAGESNSQSFGGLTVTAGSNTIRATSGSGGSIDLNLGAISRSGGLANFVLPDSGAITTSNADGLLGGWATINGSDYAKVAGGNIIAFEETDYTNKDDAATWADNEIISDTANAADTPFAGTVGGNVQLGGLRYTAAADSEVTIDAASTLGIDGTIIVAPSVLDSNQTITGGSLTGGTGGGTLGVRQNGEGLFTIASTIVDNGGAVSFVKGGGGTLVLTGANTYTGTTTLTDGTLRVGTIGNGGAASSIGASSAASSSLVLESGVLQYTGGTATTDRGFTLVNGSGTRTIEITNGATDLTFTGQVTSPDDAGLTKAGPGTLTLANAGNDYIGVTTVSGGTLAVTTLTNGGLASSIGAASSDPANIVLAGGTLAYTGGTTSIDRGMTLGVGGGGIGVTDAGTTLTLTGVLTGTALRKEGAGTLVLSGANTYTNSTSVNQGTLQAGAANVFGSGSMTVNAGTLLDLNDFNNAVGPLNGSGDIDLGTATLTVNSGGTFTGTISGTGGLTRAGTNQFTLTLSGCNNSYTGVTAIVGTALAVDCLADGNVNSSIGASSNAAENLTFHNGTLLYTGADVVTDRGFTIVGGAGVIDVANAATTLEFSGDIVGGGGLRKDGAGTLVLSGTNLSTGNARIREGTLRAESTAALGSGVLTLDNTAGVLLDLNGFDNSVAYLAGGGANGGDIHLGGATLTINSGGSLAGANYAGAIDGTSGIVKNGPSIQQLSGCNSSYTGRTVINAGTLAVTCLIDGGNNSSIGASTADVGNLVLNGGTLQYIGAAGSTDRQFTLGPATTSKLNASGTGAISFTNNGAIAFSSADTAQTLTLGGTNTGNNSLAAQITDNGAGTTSLTKTDAGTWILTNQTSDYTGATTISGGVLGVDKLADGGVASSIGASTADASKLIIGQGSTLRYTGSGDTTNRLFTLSAGVTYLESSGTGAIVFTDTGPVTLQGNNQARTIALGGTNTGNNTLAGSIGNAGSGITTLAKNDSGTWVLTGNHTYTGSTNINGGILFIGGGGTTGSIASSTVNNFGTLAFNRSDSLSYAGLIVGAGAVNQAGAGTTILTGDNSYKGATTVSAGTLRINGDQSTATGLTSVLAGGTLGGSGIIGGSVQVADGGRLAPGNSPGTLTINGDLALSNASILDIEFGQANVVGGPLNDLIDVQGDLTLDGTVNVAVSAGGDFGAGVYRVINYGGTLTDNGLGVGTTPPGSQVFVQTSVANQINLVNTAGLTLNYWDGDAGPKFNGQVNGGNGQWQSNGGNDNWTEVSGTINVPYTDNSFAIFSATPGTVVVDNSLGAVNAAGMQFASNGYVITGDALTLVGPQSTIRVGDGTAAGAGYTATIDADLTGATQLVKTDLGTLTLTGANVYTGGTAINGGTLRISSDANLGDVAGGLTLDGGTLQTTATLMTARAVALAGAGNFLTDAGTTLTLGGAVAGAGGLTKDGAGTLLLAGNAVHTGGTTITAGTLQLGNGGVTGSLSGDVANNGTLIFNRSDAIAFGGVISGTGAVQKLGAGTLVLTADNSHTGGTTITAGTLQLGNGGTTGSLVGNVANNGTLVFNRTDAVNFDGTITGTGALTHAGAGTTVLTADNSYTGLTDIQGGTLVINGNQSAAVGLMQVAGTLAGVGVVGGDVVVAAGGALNPGDLGTVPGTLTINGDLGLNSGAVLNYSFGQANIVGGAYNDLITVGGDLVLDGTLNVQTAAGGSFETGIYRVIDYGGTLTNNGLDSGTIPSPDFHIQTSVANQVNLVNTSGMALRFWDGADTGLYNNGAVNGGDGLWQNSTGNDNWTEHDGMANAPFADAAFAVFMAEAGTVTVDASLGAVRAAGLQFASDGYVITGEALELVGSEAIVRVGDGTLGGAAFTATVQSELTGTARLVKTDLGTLVLSGANSYTGGTAVNGGTLQIASDAALGAADGGLSFNGGTLATTADMDSARTVALDGIGTFLTDANTTLTLGGAVIGAGSLAKDGTGTLVLTGANSYAGTTDVLAGTLLVNGDQSAATGLTSVMSGASLGGTGVIGGDVALADGARLAPGSNGTGTLTIGGDLSLAAGVTLDYQFGAANAVGGALNDLVEVGGDLTLDGTIDVTVPDGGNFGAGVYRVFNYAGSLTDNGLSLGILPAGSDIVVQTSIAGQINLVNAGGQTLNYWDGATGPKNNGLVNGGDGLWQNSLGNDNWTNAEGVVNAAFTNDSFAIFAGTAGTVTVDNSLGQVAASGLQFASHGYVIEGDTLTLVGPEATIRVGDGTTAGAAFAATIEAELGGTSRLVKTDGGTLILAGENSYTGGTRIAGGTLQIATDAALGAASGGVSLDGGTLATTADLTSGRSLEVAGTGTLRTAAETTLTLGGAVSGTGALTKDGAGTLVLTADSAGFAGSTAVKAGTLAVNGTLGGTMDVLSGGRLQGTGRVGATTLRSGGVIAPGSNGIGTLTIAGNFAGEGGLVEIEAELGDDGSATDRLVITGDTSGTANVNVVNLGGAGALTTEGIKIIDILGTSNGQFALVGDYVFQGQQAVIGGAYAYTLHKGGVSSPSDGDWYLRSDALNPPEEPQEPQEPGTPTPPNPPAPQPIYQPGVPVYETYQHTLAALNGLPTLQQRVGSRQWAQGLASSEGEQGVWGRYENTSVRAQATTSTSGSNADVDSWKMQMGVDATLVEGEAGSALIAGLNAFYGEAQSDVVSAFGTGAIKADGYGVGAAVTWYGSDGVYADAQAQLSWYETELTSHLLGSLAPENGGKGQALSLEVGKRAAVGGKLTLTPQAQLAYAHVSFDRFRDVHGAEVSSREGASLKGRLGLSLDHRNGWTGGSGKAQFSHLYAVANLTYEFLDGMRTEVSGTQLLNRHERLWSELGLGGSYSWGNGRYTVYAQGTGSTAVEDFGDSYSFKGSAGFRIQF